MWGCPLCIHERLPIETIPLKELASCLSTDCINTLRLGKGLTDIRSGGPSAIARLRARCAKLPKIHRASIGEALCIYSPPTTGASTVWNLLHACWDLLPRPGKPELSYDQGSSIISPALLQPLRAKIASERWRILGAPLFRQAWPPCRKFYSTSFSFHSKHDGSLPTDPGDLHLWPSSDVVSLSA